MTHQEPQLITFTGVDENTNLSRCAELAKQYPLIEFGFLSSSTKEAPRYTGMHMLNVFMVAGLRVAVHLCGRAARQAMHTQCLPDTIPEGVRVQVNLRDDDYTWGGLRSMARTHRIIRQTRNTEVWPHVPLNVSPLLDCSGGRGTEIAAWPVRPPPQPVGYAGGLRPDNVVSVLRDLPQHTQPFWIDMETGVRTQDWFDIDKCAQVCQAVWSPAPGAET